MMANLLLREGRRTLFWHRPLRRGLSSSSSSSSSSSGSSSAPGGSSPQPSWSPADEASDTEGEGSPLAQVLNQVYVDYRFKQLAPSWLPLNREASFFIPPFPPLTKIIQEQQQHAPAPTLSPEEIKFATNPLGWISDEAIAELEAVAVDLDESRIANPERNSQPQQAKESESQ